MTDAPVRQSLLLVALSIVLIAGCPQDCTVTNSCTITPPPPVPPPALVDHITIRPANPTILLGGNPGALTVDFFDVNGNPVTGATGSVAWSAQSAIVTFNPASGLVTQLGAASLGSTQVTAVFTPTASTVTVAAQQITSLTLSPSTASVAMGTPAAPFTATVRDQNGHPMAGVHSVTWQSLNTNIATIGAASGTITGVTAGGPVTIRAISDGNQSVSGDAQVTITPAPLTSVRIAYAVADQPSAASYTADLAAQFNGLGGPITVTRGGPGQYTVTIPGFGGAVGESRLPFVNALTASTVVCQAISWTMIGVTDATVQVACSGTTGTLTDSRFTIMAVGQSTLPGRFAFANSGPTASYPPVGGSITLGSASAWSSAGPAPTLSRLFLEPAGRYVLDLKVPSTGFTDIIPVLQPSGNPNSRCAIDFWGTVEGVRVICFPIGSVGGVPAEASFSAMLLEQGRTGKRWGTSDRSSFSTLTRNSTGAANSVTQTGVGTYRVTFTNLGRPVGGKETVLVTSWTLDAASCNPSGWSTVGSHLVVDVVCFNGAGAPRDGEFIVVLIE